MPEFATWDWERGEGLGGEEDPKDGCMDSMVLELAELMVFIEFMGLRKGKEDDNVETGGTGNEGENEDEIPKEEESGSGLLLVRLRLGDPARGLCLMFLNTLR
jgi:hypothetical protein